MALLATTPEEVRPEEAFQEFFREEKYRNRLGQLSVPPESKSLIVDFDDLIQFDHKLAIALQAHPDDFLKHAAVAAIAQLRIEDPQYAEQLKEVKVRFRRLLDKTALRATGAEHLKRLVAIDGIVVRTSTVKPLIVKAVFRCKNCATTMAVDQTGRTMKGPGPICPNCHAKGRYELVEEESTYKNIQEVRAQERPEDLPPGQLPRYIDVRLEDDMVDATRPGDRATITGIVRAEQESFGKGGKLRTFELLLDSNYVDVLGKETELLEITPEDERQILEYARDPWIHRKLILSIAPSIYGYEDIKEAILYLLCGGVPKVLPDGITIRGDANVLLIGDPGVAKSQLLMYVAKIAPRGLYTSGRGTTAAGLTAAVIREKTGGMVLEAGALVLADKGVASVDEIDKMRPEDRVAMHEVLEQQQVSVAKGGIVATLNARTSILAAANPALGRYEPHRNVSENISLPITILSRFDLIFIMRDIPEKEMDIKMSDHILSLHRARALPESSPLSPELLRKYLVYARKVMPVLSEEASNEIRNFYLKMRDKSTTESAIAITPRQLEALVRLAEARARSFLRSTVTLEDAQAVLRLMSVSLEHVGIDVKTGVVDIDTIMTGKPRSMRDSLQRIIDVIAEFERETGTVEESQIYEVLRDREKMEERDSRRIITQLIKEGILYSPRPGHLKRTAG